MSLPQKLYNGVRLLGNGPSPANVEKIDLGSMPMISMMAQTGLQVDLNHFAKLDKDLSCDLDKINEEVKIIAGRYINLDSPQQVSKFLFKDLGLKQARPSLTTSGMESTGNEVLVAIQHNHPVIPKILDYKELSKLLGTYVRPMPKLAKKVAFGEWRMFPNFKTTRVPSGRLSASEPNLLAMPTRTDKGSLIRKGFIAKQGWKIVSIDESQIEVRITAHRSKDPGLLRIYQNEEDIYSDFAIPAFALKDGRYFDQASGKWKYPTVQKMEHRYPAKTCILAAIYDVTAGGLLEQMPVICANCKLKATEHTCGSFRSLWSENGCQDLLNKFYIQYPGILDKRIEDHDNARKFGYIWDMWGRLLHVAAVNSVLEWVVSAALREVGNFPNQSGAQGTIKLTMAIVYDAFENGNYWDVVKPLLQVHDELIFEIREDVAEECGRFVAGSFEGCVRLDVPIKANVAMADSWGHLEK